MSPSRPAQPRDGVLVISRSLGEGFWIGETWRLKIAQIKARYVTLEITDGTETQTCELEAECTLRIDDLSEQDFRTPQEPIGVKVMRVTSHHARLAVKAPRTLKIRRNEHDTNIGQAEGQ